MTKCKDLKVCNKEWFTKGLYTNRKVECKTKNVQNINYQNVVKDLALPKILLLL